MTKKCVQTALLFCLVCFFVFIRIVSAGKGKLLGFVSLILFPYVFRRLGKAVATHRTYDKPDWRSSLYFAAWRGPCQRAFCLVCFSYFERQTHQPNGDILPFFLITLFLSESAFSWRVDNLWRCAHWLSSAELCSLESC